MATVLVIVSDVSSHESDEMALAQNYDVIEELAPTAADPALGGSVLPRAAIRGANRLCAHGPYELDDAGLKIASPSKMTYLGAVS